MSTRQAARFVTFEGIEGSGKSSALAHARTWLEQCGIKTCIAREPGGTPLAEEIRTLVLRIRQEKVAPMAELLLLFAARAQLLAECIQPALSRGEWVLCDRFTDSTYAYQGAGRGMGERPVAELESLVLGALRPDLCILLDAPLEVALSRARGQDRIGSEEQQFMERARACYLERARQQPESCCIVDASLSLHEVCQAVTEALSGLLAEQA